MICYSSSHLYSSLHLRNWTGVLAAAKQPVEKGGGGPSKS